MTSGTGSTNKQMNVAEAIRGGEYELLVRASSVLVFIVELAASHAKPYVCVLLSCCDIPL
jgi:hypothetical protein